MRFPHNLVLVQNAQSGTSEDEYGQPVEAPALNTPFRGWLQPRSSTEIRQANDAGIGISTHILFAPAKLPVTKNDRVQWVPTDSRVYQVEGDPRDAAGRGHHLEIDVHEVTG